MWRFSPHIPRALQQTAAGQALIQFSPDTACSATASDPTSGAFSPTRLYSISDANHKQDWWACHDPHQSGSWNSSKHFVYNCLIVENMHRTRYTRRGPKGTHGLPRAHLFPELNLFCSPRAHVNSISPTIHIPPLSFIYTFVLRVCMYCLHVSVHQVHTWCQQKSEEVIGSSGTGARQLWAVLWVLRIVEAFSEPPFSFFKCQLPCVGIIKLLAVSDLFNLFQDVRRMCEPLNPVMVFPVESVNSEPFQLTPL